MPSRPPIHGAVRRQREVKASRAAYDDRRGTSTERGYDSRWRKARLGFLAKHPLCEECNRQGRIVAATVVDHVVPHCGDQVLFWQRSNWEAKCKSCHDRKTAREDGGFGNRLPTTKR